MGFLPFYRDFHGSDSRVISLSNFEKFITSKRKRPSVKIHFEGLYSIIKTLPSDIVLQENLFEIKVGSKINHTFNDNNHIFNDKIFAKYAGLTYEFERKKGFKFFYSYINTDSDRFVKFDRSEFIQNLENLDNLNKVEVLIVSKKDQHIYGELIYSSKKRMIVRGFLLSDNNLNLYEVFARGSILELKHLGFEKDLRIKRGLFKIIWSLDILGKENIVVKDKDMVYSLGKNFCNIISTEEVSDFVINSDSIKVLVFLKDSVIYGVLNSLEGEGSIEGCLSVSGFLVSNYGFFYLGIFRREVLDRIKGEKNII